MLEQNIYILTTIGISGAAASHLVIIEPKEEGMLRSGSQAL